MTKKLNIKRLSFTRKIDLVIKYLPNMALLSGGWRQLLLRIFKDLTKGLNGPLSFFHYHVIPDEDCYRPEEQLSCKHTKTLIEAAKLALHSKNLPSQITFVIVLQTYKSHSAGVRVLYRLCHDLNNLGVNCYIVGSSGAPKNLICPIVTPLEARKLVQMGAIAVYPETILGNPLKSEKVVRFIGNTPGLLGGPTKFENDALVFSYSKIYTSGYNGKVDGILFIPSIDEDIFFPPSSSNKKRSLTCYYVGKSRYRAGYFNSEGCVEITRSWPERASLGDIFRASKALYCFDNSTILAYEALMCGCPVVIIPDGTSSYERYQEYELGADGIAWGIENLPRSMANLPILIEKYENAKADYKRQLSAFVEINKQKWMRKQ